MPNARLEIAFLPWVTISSDLRLPGGARLLVYRRGQLPFGGQPDLQRAADALIAPYRVGYRESVVEATLIALDAARPLAILSDARFSRLRWLCESLAFDAISRRELFSQVGAYCNRAHFSAVVQRFNPSSPTSVTIRSRKRDGSTMSLWPVAHLPAPVPHHVVRQYSYAPDDAILRALHRVRGNAEIEDAVECFNQGNTDSSDIPLTAELTLLVSALERVVESRSGTAADLARGFYDVSKLKPTLRCDSLEEPRRSALRKARPKEVYVLNAWLKDLFALRGNAAHGRSVQRTRRYGVSKNTPCWRHLRFLSCWRTDWRQWELYPCGKTTLTTSTPWSRWLHTGTFCDRSRRPGECPGSRGADCWQRQASGVALLALYQ